MKVKEETMVRLLETARLKQSGAVEQRLASLEEQVGFGLGPLFLGTVLMALLAKPRVSGGCLGERGWGAGHPVCGHLLTNLVLNARSRWPRQPQHCTGL